MQKIDWLAVIIILIFLVSGIVTLSNYGISWDEGLGNMFFGERYFYYLTSFQEKYLDFNTELMVHSRHPLNLYVSPFRQYPYEFPAFADTLSAATMHLVSYRLNWLDPVDAFHLFTVILCSIFLYICYCFAAHHMGKLAALFSLVFLATFPRFWGDMHFNPKDIPESVFFSITILVYLSWYEKPGKWKAVLAGILFGCALGIKANALFIPFIIILGIWHWDIRQQPWKQHFFHLKNHLVEYIFMGVSGLLVYFLSWPYLYADPLRVKGYFGYILSQGSRTGSSGWNWEPFLQSVTTMPEIMLTFFIIGIIAVFIRNRHNSSPWWQLLPVWLLFPVFRVSMPGMVNFDGIRHFMEYVPAAAFIAGYGCSALIEKVQKTCPIKKHWLITSAGLLIALNTIQLNIEYHPYQHLYYNHLAGGLQGAAVLYGKDNATDYWAVSYRQGMQWLNNNAAGNSVLYVPIADWLVRLPAPLWLRSDIKLTSRDFSDSLFDSKYPVYVMFITRSAFYDNIADYCIENLQPVYQVKVDGVNILKIYHWDKTQP